VSDYKAILSGQSWNAMPNLANPRQPVFLTYTFNLLTPWNREQLRDVDKQAAREALTMWGDASGITFFETKDPLADIRFNQDYEWNTITAEAQFPSIWKEGQELSRSAIGGEVTLNEYFQDKLDRNWNYKLYVFLHEIGHALGLKHPFHQMAHNNQTLRSELDHVNHTVMAYNGASESMAGVRLGALDLLAIQSLYGAPWQDGKQVSAWSWNPKKEVLKQIGGPRDETIFGVAADDYLEGKKGRDKLYGFHGDDTLSGGLGSDILMGGGGIDEFRFDAALSKNNVDRILDFEEFETIQLSRKVFTGLTKGSLKDQNFSLETSTPLIPNDDFYDDEYPLTETTRIIYKQPTGQIFYDPDGSGPLGRTLFARLDSRNYLEAGDFSIV
jgi:hypothetical protein